MSEKASYTLSSGNVFADLVCPPYELLAKADLNIQICLDCGVSNELAVAYT